MARLAPSSPRNLNVWKEPIIHNMFYAVIDLIFESYNQIIKEITYNKYPKEDVLRNGLVRYMKKNKKIQCLIMKESAVDDNEDITKGRMDITVYFNNNEEQYFSFECKRVSENEWTKDINKLYIKQGLMDYINLKYSEKLNMGGMIAFIEEGNLNTICDNIVDKVKSKKCFCVKGCNLRTHISHERVYHSEHVRINNTNIDIYHVILDYSNIIK